MAHKTSTKLDIGDRFPDLIYKLVDGKQISLPLDTVDHWTVFLGYRGKW